MTSTTPEPTGTPTAPATTRRRGPTIDDADPLAPVVTLSDPLVIPGVAGGADTRIEAVTLRLGKLRGGDVIDASRAAQGTAQGAGALSVALDTGFHVEIAARCSGLSVEQLRGLAAIDLLALAQLVQAFFLDAG